MTLLRVEVRRLLHRRAPQVLMGAFVLVILGVVITSFLRADAAQPLTGTFVRDSGQGFGGGFALVALLVGATAGGAEWGAGTMEALLLWECRRLRIIVAKAGAVVAVTIGAALAVHILVAVLATATVTAQGPLGGGWDLWQSYASSALRATALSAYAAVFGFTLSSLTRSTGAALGAAFIYLAIVEHLLALISASLEPFGLIGNVAALLVGDLDVGAGENTVRLTTARAVVTLSIYAVALVVLAGGLFSRRDVT